MNGRSSVSPDLHSEFCNIPYLPWYGIRTKSNYEKLASLALQGKGYEQYLPTYRSRSRASGRMKEIERPLFPGYVFCRFDTKWRLPILITPGVISVVGFGNEPAPIPDSEIEAIQIVRRSGLIWEPCPYLHEGQQVRINCGSLEGVEGILLHKKSEWRVVVSVTMLRRSVSVEIDSEWIAKG